MRRASENCERFRSAELLNEMQIGAGGESVEFIAEKMKLAGKRFSHSG